MDRRHQNQSGEGASAEKNVRRAAGPFASSASRSPPFHRPISHSPLSTSAPGSAAPLSLSGEREYSDFPSPCCSLYVRLSSLCCYVAFLPLLFQYQYPGSPAMTIAAPMADSLGASAMVLPTSQVAKPMKIIGVTG